MPCYVETIFTVSRHGNIVKAHWEVEGGDDPFAIIDVTRGLDEGQIREELELELTTTSLAAREDGPAMKSLFDITDQRVQQLAADLRAIPGVEEQDGRAAFAISRNEILLNTTPGSNLDAVEDLLLAALAKFFGTTSPAELQARQYALSVVDGRHPTDA